MIYMGDLLPSGRINFLLIILLKLFVSFANAEESKKLIAFDYAIADTLSALHQPPIAMAGLAQYRRFYRDPLLPEARELGNRFQPNLEYLAALEPDAILISPPAHLNLENKLSRIANVRPIRLLWKGQKVWESLENMTRELGDLSDNQQRAKELINDVEVALAVMAEQIKRTGEPLFVAQIIDDRHLRLYGSGSLEDMVLTRLGLENAWQGPTNDWGFSTLTISEAFQLEGRFILLNPAYSQYLTDSALPTSGLWQHWLDDLPISIEVNYWSWGGFPSALRFAEALVDALDEAGDSAPAPRR
ncbi:ABC transporter substrate-binding protein [Halomonas salipaludis]|uniref:Fe/B12 periplasmic-binding domain-containing protein n=1 Tax=Halomonas salipaludis TaxID=2032625 RepID=A0A2A2EPC5_9GAMM|nr:ABC transporter substrate-binding protein [Halomonas salipaludis]PAU75311.1 hypothetical protein CK498_19420 [Halomonas salipaludis]